MKPIINEDLLKRRLFHLTNRFPLVLLLVSLVLLYCYYDLKAISADATVAVFNSEVFAKAFFQATIVTVVVYFYKSKIMGGTLSTSPSDFTQGNVVGYLPCIYGAWPHLYQSGLLLLEDGYVRFYAKKAGGFKMTKEFCKISEVKFGASGLQLNPFTPILFGQTDTLHLVTPTHIETLIFPFPKESAQEITEFISKLNR